MYVKVNCKKVQISVKYSPKKIKTKYNKIASDLNFYITKKRDLRQKFLANL